MDVIKHSIWFSIFILCIASCGNPDNGIFIFNIEDVNNNKTTLAEIADDITYVTLENYCPIGLYYDIKIFPNDIFIPTYESGILVFDREGNFKRKIGVRGRGPGEYLGFTSIDVDYGKGLVYVLDQNNIKVYSINGYYVKTISFEAFQGEDDDMLGPENTFHEIYFFNNNLLLPVNTSFGRAKNNWVCLDTTGNFVTSKINYIPPFKSYCFWLPGTSRRYKDRIVYQDHYNDTVFSILPNLDYEPLFLINMGDRIPLIPSEELNIEGRINFETDRFWVLRYQTESFGKFIILNKDDKKSFYFDYVITADSNDGPKYTGGIYNDLDGGFPFHPRYYHEENSQEFLIDLLLPNRLKTYVASDEFKSSEPKFPEKKVQLEELANRMEDTDNPIIVMVRLK